MSRPLESKQRCPFESQDQSFDTYFTKFAEKAIKNMTRYPSNCELFDKLSLPLVIAHIIFMTTFRNNMEQKTVGYLKRLQQIHFPHCSSTHQT